MMAATLARSTSSSTRSYRDFILNVTNRDARFERKPKELGSLVLVKGEWVKVMPGDEHRL